MAVQTSFHGPRVSSDTRRLLATAALALLALWVLARVRFPDRPATPNPVPPLLSQLAATPTYAELAAEVGQVYGRIRAILEARPSGLADCSDLMPVEFSPQALRHTLIEQQAHRQ